MYKQTAPDGEEGKRKRKNYGEKNEKWKSKRKKDKEKGQFNQRRGVFLLMYKQTDGEKQYISDCNSTLVDFAVPTK